MSGASRRECSGVSPEFRIRVRSWLNARDCEGVEEATAADLEIAADSQKIVTLVRDTVDESFRDGIRVSAFDLASWIASNWWRLRWETEREGIDWKMCHKMSATGGGYVWPDVSFASDGQAILIKSRETFAHTSPIHHLGDFDTCVSGDAFEKAIDGFVESVINRLGELENQSADSIADAKNLVGLWNEIREERGDPEQASWRKVEAMLGYDPDEAPEHLLKTLMELRASRGAEAVEEMLAVSNDVPPDELDQFWNESRSAAFDIQIPKVEEIRERMRRAKICRQSAPFMLPQKRAAEVAAIVREVWGLDKGPLPTKELQERIGVSQSTLNSHTSICQNAKASAGFRDGSDTSLSVFVRRAHVTGRRFDLARLIGDHVDTDLPNEKVLPSTRAKTARQKFQCAFAREFLCPVEDLQEHVGLDRIDDGLGESDIEEVAKDFGVSGFTVEHVLEDRGLVDRDTIF